MNAGQIMTRDVVTIKPSLSARDIARCLVEHRISAVPVVDESGAVVGVVSEGDLIGGGEVSRDERAAWWVEMLAEGEKLAPEFLDYVRSGGKLARDIMSRNVVTVSEQTPIGEVAKILASGRIKRVPVLREGKLVGILSRADLVRALAHEEDRRPQAATPAPRHA